MTLLITIISIVCITSLAAFIKKRVGTIRIIASPFFCPICIGVSITWMWMLAGVYMSLLDPEQWSTILAMLMGGSVVGLGYTITELWPRGLHPRQRLQDRLPTMLIWKTGWLIVGFGAVYYVLMRHWLAVVFMMLAIAWVVKMRKRHSMNTKNSMPKNRSKERVNDIENQLKNCC